MSVRHKPRRFMSMKCGSTSLGTSIMANRRSWAGLGFMVYDWAASGIVLSVWVRVKLKW
jgi:hypothetical protein